MKVVRRFFGALAIACCMFTLSASAGPASDISDETMVNGARAIITGRVTRIESGWDAARNNLFTHITIAVSQVLKGEITDSTIVIEQIGGIANGKQRWLVGSPEFSLDEEVLLFLKTDREGVLHTAYLGRGKYSIRDGQLRAQGRIVDENAARYIENIRTLIGQNQTQAVRLESDLVEIKSAPIGYKPGVGDSLNEFKLLSGRFFQPDSDMPVSFLVNTNNAPVPGGGMAETNRAIAAWNAAGTRLRLVNGGTTNLCGFNADNANVISFGDCAGQLDNPERGDTPLSGVMITLGMNTRIINGVTFRPILEADIVFNNGVASVLGIASNLEELITHNIGNAFGLDNNSTDPNEPDPLLREAVMFFLPHFDGRGARLNTDDLNGIARLYPFFRSVSLNTNLATPIVGVEYRQMLTASDGFPPFTFRVVSGTLPAGLTLDPNGLLVGTPARLENATFTVMVTDSANFTATGTFNLTVLPGMPQVLSVSPQRVCFASDTPVTITGRNLLGVNSVTLGQGQIVNFTVVNANTIQAIVRGPGQSGGVATLSIVSPGGSAMLVDAVQFAGPQILSAKFGKVKGDKKNTRAIIVNGVGLNVNQQLRINGMTTMLKAKFNDNGDLAFFGDFSGVVPKKGDVNITVLETGFCESNSVVVQRKNQ